jgi:hypothetical protein
MILLNRLVQEQSCVLRLPRLGASVVRLPDKSGTKSSPETEASQDRQS